MPWHSPEWTEFEQQFDPIALDGTLRLRIVVAEHPQLAALGIVPTWVHGIEVDADLRPRSQWRLSGLRSYFVRSGREYYLWRLPDGRQIRFERDRVGPARSSAGAGGSWRVRELSPNRFEISASDGLRWIYEAGQLQSILHPVLGTFRIESQGVWIQRLVPLTGGVAGETLLDLKFDNWGQPIAMTLKGEESHRFEWSEEGQLLRWQSGDDSARSFEYDAGLLTAVLSEDGAVQRYAWTYNPGWWRGDSRWPAPVHLSAVDELRFVFSISQKGYRIELRDDAETSAVMVLNPQRRRLVFSNGESRRNFYFRGMGAGMGQLERVEDENGRVLESYEFDNIGRMLSADRQGERMQLRYDSLGRIVNMQSAERETIENEY
ncbi:MAG: hypothetical protein JJU20_07745 [Opitutales bacterium]|nr:hypothetical protein [Opitutales bacterium]